MWPLNGAAPRYCSRQQHTAISSNSSSNTTPSAPDSSSHPQLHGKTGLFHVPPAHSAAATLRLPCCLSPPPLTVYSLTSPAAASMSLCVTLNPSAHSPSFPSPPAHPPPFPLPLLQPPPPWTSPVTHPKRSCCQHCYCQAHNTPPAPTANTSGSSRGHQGRQAAATTPPPGPPTPRCCS